MKGTAQRIEGKHVCCRIGSMLIGIGLDRVQEINRLVEPTFVPLMDPYLRGVINLRGQLVTVIDLGAVITRTEGKVTPRSRTVVVEIGDEVCGLVVDEVGDVAEVSANAIEPLPSHLPQEHRHWFRGMVQLQNDQLLLVLDVNAIGQLGSGVAKAGVR